MARSLHPPGGRPAGAAPARAATWPSPPGYPGSRRPAGRSAHRSMPGGWPRAAPRAGRPRPPGPTWPPSPPPPSPPGPARRPPSHGSPDGAAATVKGAVAVEPAGTGVCDNRTRPAPDQGASQMTSQRFRLQGQGPAAYERYLVPAQFAAGAAQLLDLAAVRPGERVLDVACGTGIVARQAAARVGPGGAVTGTDLNQGMLEAARAAAADLPVEIAWHQADAAALPCPAAPSTSPAANRACSTCPTGRPPWPRPAGCWPRGT